jgi:transposase-like protein
MSSIMESVGKKRSRPRRAFTPEFKAEIVELYQRSDRSMRQVALDFDLTETAMRSWVKQAELDADIRSDGLTSDEQAELAELRRENRRLQQDVDILKRLSSHPGDPVNVYPFTAAEQAGKHNVKRACELLQVSRSAYYQHARGERSTRGRVDEQLTGQIIAVHAASNGTYGAPRIHAELAAAGLRHGRKRIARRMRAAGVYGKSPRRWKNTTIPDPHAGTRGRLSPRRWIGQFRHHHPGREDHAEVAVLTLRQMAS